MSNSFIERAAELATSPNAVPDPDADTWAARVFGAVAVLGGIEGELSPEAAESMAIILSKAPAEVALAGTVQVLRARAMANQIRNMQAPGPDGLLGDINPS